MATPSATAVSSSSPLADVIFGPSAAPPPPPVSGVTVNTTPSTAGALTAALPGTSASTGTAVTVQVAPALGGQLTGGTGSSVLIGGPGNDVLVGGSGNNVLVGGGGQNVMTGHGLATTFGHSAGAIDIVTDFSAGTGDHVTIPPTLNVTNAEVGAINAASAGVVNATGLVMSFNDGSALALVGVTSPTPDPAWFV